MMQRIIGVVLISLITAFTLAPLLGTLYAWFPQLVSEIRNSAEHNTRRAILFGLINTIFFTILTLVFIAIGDENNAPLSYILGLLVGAVGIIGGLLGTSGIAQLVGDRLFSERNSGYRILAGSALLTLACLTPFVGWFLIAPLLLSTGLGSSVMTLLQRRRVSSEKKNP